MLEGQSLSAPSTSVAPAANGAGGTQAAEKVVVSFVPGRPLKFWAVGDTVTSVEAGGQFAEKGVAPGWRITAVGNRECSSFADKIFQDASAGAEPYTVTLSKAAKFFSPALVTTPRQPLPQLPGSDSLQGSALVAPSSPLQQVSNFAGSYVAGAGFPLSWAPQISSPCQLPSMTTPGMRSTVLPPNARTGSPSRVDSPFMQARQGVMQPQSGIASPFRKGPVLPFEDASIVSNGAPLVREVARSSSPFRDVPKTSSLTSPRPDLRHLLVSSSGGAIAWNQVARLPMQPGLDVSDGRISPLRQAGGGAGSRSASPLRPTSTTTTWPSPLQAQVLRTIIQQPPSLQQRRCDENERQDTTLQAVASRPSSPARVVADPVAEHMMQLQQAKNSVAQQQAAQQQELRSRQDQVRREMLQVMGQFGEALIGSWASSSRQDDNLTAQPTTLVQLSAVSPGVQARSLPPTVVVPGASPALFAPAATGYPVLHSSVPLAAERVAASDPSGQEPTGSSASRVMLPSDSLPNHIGNGVTTELGGALPSSPHLSSDSTTEFRNLETTVAAEQGYPLAADPHLPSLEVAAELAATAACAKALGQLAEQRNVGTWSRDVHVLPDTSSEVIDEPAPSRNEAVRESMLPPARPPERPAARTRPPAQRTPSPSQRNTGRGASSGTSRGSRSTAAKPLSPEAQEEVSRCSSTIAWCCEQLNTNSLRELRNFRHPPACVRTIFEAMGILLGIADPKSVNARKLLAGNVQERLRGVKLESISLAQFRRVRRLLALPDFEEELVRAACSAAVPLAIWCRAIGSCLAKTRFSSWGGPEIQPASPQPDEETRRVDRVSDSDRRSSFADVEADEAACGSMAIGNLVVAPDLSRLGSRELRQVKELTVSRPEVGSITFHGATDCSCLDLARLVHLDVGEVLVYPEPGSKAEIGQGLNKRATVTMYQCWPPNGRGHLEDVKAQERYRFKIQQMTEEKRAKFIDYDCATGVWKFQVDHF